MSCTVSRTALFYIENSHYISYWISLEFTNKRKVRKVKNLKVFLCVLKTLRS